MLETIRFSKILTFVIFHSYVVVVHSFIFAKILIIKIIQFVLPYYTVGKMLILEVSVYLKWPLASFWLALIPIGAPVTSVRGQNSFHLDKSNSWISSTLSYLFHCPIFHKYLFRLLLSAPILNSKLPFSNIRSLVTSAYRIT